MRLAGEWQDQGAAPVDMGGGEQVGDRAGADIAGGAIADAGTHGEGMRRVGERSGAAVAAGEPGNAAMLDFEQQVLRLGITRQQVGDDGPDRVGSGAAILPRRDGGNGGARVGAAPRGSGGTGGQWGGLGDGPDG